MKKANWLNRAYKATSVSWAKSQAQIYKMLGELGIYQIRFTNLKNKFVLEFIVQLEEGQKPRGVRITVPISYQGDDDKKREKELNIIHRILFNRLKAKFIAVSSGLIEFETEFMAHLIVTDEAGNSRTVGEMILPQYQKNLEEGKGGNFNLLPEPKNEENN